MCDLPLARIHGVLKEMSNSNRNGEHEAGASLCVKFLSSNQNNAQYLYIFPLIILNSRNYVDMKADKALRARSGKPSSQ